MGKFLASYSEVICIVYLYFLVSGVSLSTLKDKLGGNRHEHPGKLRNKPMVRQNKAIQTKRVSHHTLEADNSNAIAPESFPIVARLDKFELKPEYIFRRKRGIKSTRNGRNKITWNPSKIQINDPTIQTTIDKYDYCYNRGITDSCGRQTQRFCSCEENCVIFGDCCLDAEIQLNRTDTELLQSIAVRLNCVKINSFTMYTIVTSCSPDFVGTFLKEKCININKTDVLSFTPVYDTELKVSFRNIYCASCNTVNISNQRFWETKMRRCDYMKYSEADVLTDFINQQLNDPHSPCQLFVNPRSDFRRKECSRQYNDGYVCDGHALSHSTEALPGMSTEIPVAGTASTTYSSFNSSIQQQESTETVMSDNPQYYFNLSAMKQVCYAYKNVVRPAQNSKRYSFRNSVCAWCKLNSLGPISDCLAAAQGHERGLAFSVLINFHAALDIVWGRENKYCEENEIFDALSNVCRRLICTSRRIASYGKCMEAYRSVTTPMFSILVHGTCAKPALLDFTNTIDKHLTHIFDMPVRLIGRKFFYLPPTNQGYCYRACLSILIEAYMTHHQITKMVTFLQNIFVLNVTSGKANLTRLDIKNNLPNCTQPIQTAPASHVPCPYIPFSISEFVIFRELLNSRSITLTNDSFMRFKETYLICYEKYKHLLKLFDNVRSEYTVEQAFIKSVLSLTLVSVSLLALLISSFIYLVHPDLKTVPCRMSLNTMLTLIGTCLLFILSNIFDSSPGICYVLAILTNYFWLCVFVWSLLFGYHTVRVFSRLHLVSKPNCKARKPRIRTRLLLYGTVAYITPLIATACTVVLDRMGIFIMDYGVPTCFITNKKALLLTFGLPVIVIIFLNSVSIGVATVNMYKFASGASNLEDMKTKVFESFVKLAICLGLTWIFGIAASVTNIEALWYAHIVLNSSHGIFLFFVLIVWSNAVRSWCRYRLCF